MTTLSRTRAAVRYLIRHAPSALTRSRALIVQDKLTACGRTFTHAPSVSPSPALLRQVVIAVRDLTGPAWLNANADDPAISAFIRLDSTPSPPPSPVLDEILSRCLRTRFGPHLPAS